MIIFFIKLYQKTVSPDHGLMSVFYPYGFCRYTPTCSQYCIDAITTYGVVKGIWVGAKRLARCHPWAEPKHDPVSD